MSLKLHFQRTMLREESFGHELNDKFAKKVDTDSTKIKSNEIAVFLERELFNHKIYGRLF